MARIPYASAEAGGQPAANIYRMLAWVEPLVPGFRAFGGALRGATELDPQLRELAILRVGALSRSRYELHQHARIARDAGLSEAAIQAVQHDPTSEALNETQRYLIAFTDDLVRNVRASDATFVPLTGILGYKQLQELILNIGFYMLVCRYLETLDIDIEESAMGRSR